MSISPIDYLRYTWQMLNGFRVYAERGIAERRRHDIVPYVGSYKPLRILDVANGRLRPQYTLLKADGHHVYGIDLVNRPSRSRVDLAYGVARRLYTWKLGLRAEPHDTQTLLCGDVGRMSFPDAAFDLATSVAAFEHFLDVPAVVAELYRVLRPGGVAWISIHLFTSPTGGHNLSFTQFPLRSVPPGVDPWDHLRERRLPFFVPLNEWRKQQYLEAFARHFECVADYCAMREGEELLTPEVQAALTDYSRDELTCGAYVIVARKSC
ncbi:MAG: class I SAM-dependent methyltransferase [Roseiflexaceae bacterium]